MHTTSDELRFTRHDVFLQRAFRPQTKLETRKYSNLGKWRSSGRGGRVETTRLTDSRKDRASHLTIRLPVWLHCANSLGESCTSPLLTSESTHRLSKPAPPSLLYSPLSASTLFKTRVLNPLSTSPRPATASANRSAPPSAHHDEVQYKHCSVRVKPTEPHPTAPTPPDQLPGVLQAAGYDWLVEFRGASSFQLSLMCYGATDTLTMRLLAASSLAFHIDPADEVGW